MPDLSWRDSITAVLKDSADPLHFTEIARRVAEKGLRKQFGATPAASVAAELSTSLKGDGESSPFEKVSRGIYRLRQHEGGQTAAAEAAEAEVEEAEPETGLINAFGMYWRRENVLWSQPKLFGQQQVGSTAVNFTGQRGVYLLHDRREVVYVGRTTDQNLGRRLKDHTTDRLSGRWDRFSWFGVLPVEENGELAASPSEAFNLNNLIATMEALLIEGLEPPQNRRRGDDFNAVEFSQVLDPEIEKRRKKELMDEIKTKL